MKPREPRMPGHGEPHPGPPNTIKLEAEWQQLHNPEQRSSLILSWQFQRITRVDGLEWDDSPGHALVVSMMAGNQEQLRLAAWLRSLDAFPGIVMGPGVRFQIEIEGAKTAQGRLRPRGAQVL